MHSEKSALLEYSGTQVQSSCSLVPEPVI